MDFTDSIKLLLECLFTEKDCKTFTNEEWSIIIVAALAVSSITIKLIKDISEYRKQQKLKVDLQPYYSENEIKRSTKNYVKTKGQNIAPSRENEPRDTHAFAVREDLIKKFIQDSFNNSNEDSKFFIVLADSGMGKTTFMLNLYLSYIKKLFSTKRFHIKLFPLAYPNILDKIDKIEDKGRTILLLDALDEDQNAVQNYNNRIIEIINIIKDFRIVLITCRTQFFPNEEEESIETGLMKFGTEKGFHIFRKIYISPFNNEDIRIYLNKKYGKFSIKNYDLKRKAKFIVNQSPNLVVRPMLLSYIDDLTKNNLKFTYTFQIYKELISKWIDREAKRVPMKQTENQKVELARFSKEIALHIYHSRFHNTNLTINAQDIVTFSELHKINLNSWELTGRSLLNRNGVGGFKFAHKSILEYYIAQEYIINKNFKVDFTGYDTVKYFLYEHIHLTLKKLNGNFSVYSFYKSDLKNSDIESYLNALGITGNFLTEEEKKANQYYIKLKSARGKLISGANTDKIKRLSELYADLNKLVDKLDLSLKVKRNNEIILNDFTFYKLTIDSNISSGILDSINPLEIGTHSSTLDYIHLPSVKELISLSIYLKKKDLILTKDLHLINILDKMHYFELNVKDDYSNDDVIDFEADLSFLKYLNNIKALYINTNSNICNINNIFSLKELNLIFINTPHILRQDNLVGLALVSKSKIVIIETRNIHEQLIELYKVLPTGNIIYNENRVIAYLN